MRFGLSLRLMSLATVLIVLTGLVMALVFATSPEGQPVQVIAWGMVLSALPGMAIGLIVARRIADALSAVSEACRAVEGGDLETHIGSDRDDEIGELARHFDRMIGEIRRDREALESARKKEAFTAKAVATSARLASMGELAAGVAHEVNNPLTYVRANLGQLRNDWLVVQKQFEGRDLDEELGIILGEGEELIDESLEGVERAVSIVRDIKGFAHSGSAAPAAVELNELLDSVLRVASPQLGAQIRVDKDYAPSICVQGIGQQLKQVFLNLIVNAAQAIELAGAIRIETRESEGLAVVRVQDNGSGIEPDALDSIFDPFFTTKPVGAGTGLGLSISHEIIERHGGEMRVETQVGEGTTFSVLLPIES